MEERSAYYVEKPSGFTRAIRFLHDKDAAHDGMERTMVGIGAWWEMIHRECPIGTKRSRIEGAPIPFLTPVVSDGVEHGSGVVPENGGARINMNERGGVIGGERTNGNAQGRGSRYRQRSDYKKTHKQEARYSSFQEHRP